MDKISLRKPTPEDLLTAVTSIKHIDVWLPAAASFAGFSLLTNPLNAFVGVALTTYLNQLFRRMGETQAAS